uniref:MsrB domain-containing protein n=1 Tax=Astatotilapia calliptera TaxID=8154 RepID=A0A3P8Q3X2_ASTCA
MSFCQFFGGEIYKDHFKPGVYVCSKCNHPLFSSRSKFAHSSPWPAFTETIREDSVTKMMETLTAYKVRTSSKERVKCFVSSCCTCCSARIRRTGWVGG